MRILVAVVTLASIVSAQRSAFAQRGVVEFDAPAAGRVELRLRSHGAPLQVVVERRVERSPDEARARGVVIGASRCATPCSLWLPPGRARLRSNGPGIRGTDEDIEVPDEGATLTVRAGRAALHGAGVGLLAAGATTLVATMFVALADQGVFSGTARGSLGLEPAAVAGAAGVGAALLAGGIPLTILHRNGVSITALARSGADPSSGLREVSLLLRGRF